jgi:hypothetical protein
MALAETQQLRMLEPLRRAGNQPVTLDQLRAGGIDFPAVVIGELELNGYVIERVYEHGRQIGVCLLETEAAAPPASRRRRRWRRVPRLATDAAKRVLGSAHLDSQAPKRLSQSYHNLHSTNVRYDVLPANRLFLQAHAPAAEASSGAVAEGRITYTSGHRAVRRSRSRVVARPQAVVSSRSARSQLPSSSHSPSSRWMK